MKSALILGDQKPGAGDGTEAIMGILQRRNVVCGGQSWAWWRTWAASYYYADQNHNRGLHRNVTQAFAFTPAPSTHPLSLRQPLSQFVFFSVSNGGFKWRSLRSQWNISIRWEIKPNSWDPQNGNHCVQEAHIIDCFPWTPIHLSSTYRPPILHHHSGAPLCQIKTIHHNWLCKK